MFKEAKILFLVFVLIGESLLPNGLGISQASKIGELYNHFQEHKSEGTSLQEFLWMHYANDSSHKQRDEHKKLPNIQGTSGVVFISNLSLTEILYSKNVFLRENTLSSDFYKNFYVFQFQDIFLVPPRFA